MLFPIKRLHKYVCHGTRCARAPRMRNKTASCTAALLILFFVACGARESSEAMNTDTSSTDSTASTISDTSATTTASTGGTVSAMSPADKEFVMATAAGGMGEVQMGQVAAQKALSPEVKAYAQRMVTDHTKANDELSQLATLKGLALPTDTDQPHKDAAQHVAGLSGAAFDKAYMTHMVEDHQKTVADFERQSTSATDADLKTWASKTLPTLQDHLRQAQTIAGKLR